jgi:hypothetical protein
MKPTHLLIATLPLALLAACGGASTSTFEDAAPSYQELSMDLTSSDTSAPNALVASTASSDAAAMTMPECHPHLFIRTHDVVSRVNRHLWHFLRHVEGVIHRNPDISTSATQVWEHVKDGIDARFTMTRTSDTAFAWKLDLKQEGAADFTTVFSGQIDRASAQGSHQGTGDATLDLSALSSVTGQDVAGVITVSFESLTGSRKVVVDAKGVIWDSDTFLPVQSTPRDAHYVYFREPGKGGSLKIDEQMVFACPSNLALVPADVKLVSRWYKTTSGSVHGRSDALMTGGQLPTENKVIGLTCHQSDVEGADQAESYWLMKQEDVSGKTVDGALHSTSADSSTCDPALNPPTGAVPTLEDASADFDMSPIEFTDSTPYPFPGM